MAITPHFQCGDESSILSTCSKINLTEDDLTSLKGTLALIGSQPLLGGWKWPKVLCNGPCSMVHSYQAMGNKPSVKSKPVVSTEGLFFYNGLLAQIG